MLTLLQVFGTSLKTKDVQVWLRHEEEQAVIADLGWDGAFGEVVGDALALNEANIGGQKTDAVIQERVEHDIEIQNNGSVVDTVTLYREHGGEKDELFHGANNVAYIRVYAPLGSELLFADGFQPPPKTAYKEVLPEDPSDADVDAIEQQRFIDLSGVRVTEEFGRTVFGGWVQLGPGKSSKTSFRYKLPVNVFELSERLKEPTISSVPSVSPSHRAAYLLSLTNQSGKPDRGLRVRVHAPAAWKTAWSNRAWVDQGEVRTLTLSPWDRDHIVALLFDLPHNEAR
jgi:hypothetical protein